VKLHWLVLLAACSKAAVPDAGTPFDAGIPEVDAGSREVTFKRVVLTPEFFAEGEAVGDFDHDGNTDIASGPYWYSGPGFTARHELFAPMAFDIHSYSDCFFMFPADFDRDGWMDLMVVGFPGTGAFWLQNPHVTGTHWARMRVLDAVDDESPQLVDLTGDGGHQLVSANGGRLGWSEANPADPTAPWTFIPASAPGAFQAFTHGLGIGDVDGDGRNDLLEATGVWLQPPDARNTTWVYRPWDFGPGGAQMFATDVDGDGDADIVTSLMAHGFGHAWYEQRDGGFEQHLFSSTMADGGLALHEPHALAQADFNGDGLLDLVAGERFWAHVPAVQDPAIPARLYWFELTRDAGTAQYVPHFIDDQSGVGTQVTAADVNGDGKPDVITAGKKGAYVFLQQ
jgi:hypothetical protein